MSDEKDSIKAKDMLPPDEPAEPDVETRKIGIRRVTGLMTGDRLWQRTGFRPAGNSRSFWRNIEADDPFKRKPVKPSDTPIEVYATQRIPRTKGSLPKPQPDIAKAYPPQGRDEAPPEREAPRPQPRREAKRKKAPPEPSHLPDPRPAPHPTRTPPPEPEVPPADEVVRPPPRKVPPRVPSKAPGESQKGRPRLGGGRTRMPSARQDQPQAVPQAAAQRPSAAEIRRQKQLERDGGPKEKAKSLDTYRDFIQTMEVQQAAYDRGEEIPTATGDKDVDAPHWAKAKKAKKEAKKAAKPAKAPKPQAPPAPTPDKEPAPPPMDRSPPKPAKKAPPKEINRSPSGGGSGGLNDLFGGGGGGDTRVRLGRRKKPTAQAEPEEDEDKD